MKATQTGILWSTVQVRAGPPTLGTVEIQSLFIWIPTELVLLSTPFAQQAVAHSQHQTPESQPVRQTLPVAWLRRKAPAEDIQV